MRSAPSDRDLALVGYRDQGHTSRETAIEFGLSTTAVHRIERRVRDYWDANARLKDDPDNILLLARTGRVVMYAAHALRDAGIERIDQLRGYTFRDMLILPNMGSTGADQIVKLAASRGIDIK